MVIGKLELLSNYNHLMFLHDKLVSKIRTEVVKMQYENISDETEYLYESCDDYYELILRDSLTILFMIRDIKDGEDYDALAALLKLRIHMFQQLIKSFSTDKINTTSNIVTSLVHDIFTDFSRHL